MQKMESGFTKIYSTKATDITPVNKYRSDSTGLTVVIAEVEGPIVSSYICLATEALDDDGLPHTLEHLVFMGSERFPYKGLLDLLANRCLASGTNAWTDVDHTAYSLVTAGAAGTLALLPVYLDHVLWPQLTDHAFLTEVHHVTGRGTHAGVVYCEMQGTENSAESRCYNKLQQMIYPGSGFSSETGGKLHNLRTSTTNLKVKEYHRKFYRPENVTLIVAGKVDAEDVFRALKSVEDNILSEGERAPFERPWQESVADAGAAEEVELNYPSDQEDAAMVMLGWRGPELTVPGGLETFTALSVLLRYLCDTPAAPLQRALVEAEPPLAGSVVHSMCENAASMMCIMLENVDLGAAGRVVGLALGVLEEVAAGREGVQLERVQRLLRLQRREALAHLEDHPHEALSFLCIADMLQSHNNQQMEERLNKQRILCSLEAKDAAWWNNLCQAWLCAPCKAVVGLPSTALMEQMAREEEERVQKTVSALGEKGLREKEKQLEEAMAHNGREVPAEVLRSIGVAGCSSIHYHPTQSWASGGVPCPHFPLQEMPFYTRLHQVQCHFIYINMVADTSLLSEQERAWLPLLLTVLLESPVRREGALLPHTCLLQDVEELTNGLSFQLGIRRSKTFSPGDSGQLAVLSACCEAQRYEETVGLLWEVLMATEPSAERLLVAAQRLASEVISLRREGASLAADLLRDLCYMPESNVHHCSILRQLRFLRSVQARLEEGGEGVLLELAAVRTRLLQPSRLWLHLSGDLAACGLSSHPWRRFGPPAVAIPPPPPSDLALQRQALGGSVVGVGALESCFLEQVSPGPPGLDHPDLPSLLVALQYFTQLEGPMWRRVRGAGLAYGSQVTPAPGEGLLRLVLFKSTDPVEAFRQTLHIFNTFLDTGVWDENLFASAKSSLVFELVQKVKSPSKLISESLYKFCHQVDEDYTRQMVAAVCGVTEGAALAAARRWLPEALRPGVCALSLVCPPSRVAPISREFLAMGYELSVHNTLEESHLNRV